MPNSGVVGKIVKRCPAIAKVQMLEVPLPPAFRSPSK